MSSFNSEVFANILIGVGFKEIARPNTICRRFSLRSAEGLELAQADLDHKDATTLCFMQQEFDWRPKVAGMLRSEDELIPSYRKWLKRHIDEAIHVHHVGLRIARHIGTLYENTIYKVVRFHEFNMPVVEIQFEDGDGFFTLQKYSICVADENMVVNAHIAGRASRYDSDISEDLQFEKLTDWLTRQHKTNMSLNAPAIEREVAGRIYHLYRTQDAARSLPLYRGAKSVKIIRETLVTKFEGDDVFNLIGEIDTGRTTYEFIAYEIGVVI